MADNLKSVDLQIYFCGEGHIHLNVFSDHGPVYLIFLPAEWDDLCRQVAMAQMSKGKRDGSLGAYQ